MAALSDLPDHIRADAETMLEFGITYVPIDRFHYRSYRYSTLSDALAQAKRDQSARTQKGG